MNPMLGKKATGDSASSDNENAYARVIVEMIAAGEVFYGRQWLFGSVGEFSAVVSRHPFALAITAAGSRKGRLTKRDFLLLDPLGQTTDPMRQAPVEAPIHLAIIAERDAGAVLHTNSVWSILLSDLYAERSGLTIEGFETLRGLPQAPNRERREWLPILGNKECQALSDKTIEVLRAQPAVRGILFQKHGLYTWGKNVEEAARNVEIFELLFEVLGRRLHVIASIGTSETPHSWRV